MTSPQCSALRLLVTLAAGGFALSATAQILGARPLPVGASSWSAPGARPGPRAWPVVRPPLGTEIIARADTDAPGHQIHVRFPAAGFSLDGERMSDWRPVPRPSRYALEWNYRWAPEVLLGIAELPPAVFSTSLDGPAWDGYLRKLRQEHGPRLQLLSNDDSLENKAMLRPLGNRVRVLDYRIEPEQPGQEARRIIQVFCVLPAGVVVFGCEGPAPLVEQSRRIFTSLLTRIE